VKVWREKALHLAENTKKGDRLLVRGELKYDSYQDGEKSHKSYYVLAREIARV
jgi:single-stranded DNA-binding protein